MINALWLLLIIPVSALSGVLALALVSINKSEDDDK